MQAKKIYNSLTRVITIEKKHMKLALNHRTLVIIVIDLNTKPYFQKQKNTFSPIFHKIMCGQCLTKTTKFCQHLTKF
jgi:hypothetical protein